LAETVETEEEFEIDDEMLEIFALEAEDIVRAINANLEILSKTPNSREALLEIRRNAHTLKGSAGIVGLKHLS
jgi:chemotaxis protein histidine kinase CheA